NPVSPADTPQTSGNAGVLAPLPDALTSSTTSQPDSAITSPSAAPTSADAPTPASSTRPPGAVSRVDQTSSTDQINDVEFTLGAAVSGGGGLNPGLNLGGELAAGLGRGVWWLRAYASFLTTVKPQTIRASAL